MTALLYYSISSDLTEDKIIEIDRYVTKNREFVRNLPSNSKRKAKRVFLYATFIFQLGQPLVPYAAAVMIPLPPQISIEHLVPAEVLRSNNQCPGIAPIIKAKIDKMTLTDQQIEDLNIICYKLQKGSITLDKAVLKLRAGGFYDWATLAFIIYMFSLQQGNSFQNVPLPHQDPFGWLSGKYDSRNVGNGQCLSHPPSRFERETLHTMKQMCAASADENVKDAKVEIVYRIKENPALVREAERAGRDQDAQRSINNLVEQLSLGNRNPGIGTENVFKDVYELRGKNRARVYYREVGGKIEILGKSVKTNQQKVINILKKMYG